MKPLRIRAVAAFGVVPVALTSAGSSGSHGGSSGKKSDSTHTGHQRTFHLKPGTTNALRDVRIMNCAYGDAVGRPAARVAVRNGGSPPHACGLTAKFTTGTGDAAVSAPVSRGDVVFDGGVLADLGLQALTPAPRTVRSPSGAGSSRPAGWCRPDAVPGRGRPALAVRLLPP